LSIALAEAVNRSCDWLSSPHHYTVLFTGETALTARLLKPVLVDGGTGKVIAIAGLLSALLGEGGVWWWMSWITLGIPLVVIASFGFLRPRKALGKRSTYDEPG
jgi:hypothetical protein